jgi:DNA-binding MltR family transcriptional regulator
MFGGNGFLTSLSAKIDLGYCVGLYNKKTHHDLHIIRRIRNRFAHEFGPLAFDHEEIAGLCKSMQTKDYEDGVVVQARTMYVDTFALMMWYLAKISKFKIRPVKDETNLPEGFREHVPYL